MKINIPNELTALARDASYPVYVVGGHVRNQLKGLKDTDIDISGPVPAEALGLPKFYRIMTVNYRLGTALISVKGKSFEYTPFRTENYAKGGAHTPASVAFTQDLKLDARRRDFTAGAVYYDILKDELIDPLGGLADIENGILRAVDYANTFASDGLRLLRLARIAAETGFKIDGKTAALAVRNRENLKDISAERKQAELVRILNADQKNGIENAHYRALKILHKLQLLEFVVPRLLEGDGVEQNPVYHKYDVLEHIFQTVRFAAPEVRLAALFHDIGKPYCAATFGKMHGHERVSERIALETLGEYGLKFPKKTVEETARLCALHMYDLSGTTGDGKMRLFVVKNYDIIDKLCALIRADILGSGMRTPPEKLRLEEYKELVAASGAPLSLKDLEIDGTVLTEIGYAGESIGEILSELFSMCVLEPRLNNAEWLYKTAQRRLEKAQK